MGIKSIISEETFESNIVNLLVYAGGYQERNASAYSQELALFSEDVVAFIQDSQPKEWEKLAKIVPEDTKGHLISRLCKELELRGTLDVIRSGITDYGIRFNLAFFKPETSLNPETQALYDKNILTVTRQVHYSKGDEYKSIDLLLSLNGLPIATVELKNQFTGQTSENAKHQYKFNRDPREVLFKFKTRAVVHFAVDTDTAWITTKIDGTNTRYLPFNKGFNQGAGNPPVENDYRTNYLWKVIWRKDSWMDIIGRYIHLQVEDIEDKVHSKMYKKEEIIFPRYHQLEAVRQVVEDVRREGCGKNYLIQHSAGSGKSNTIAWLAYRLSSLHSSANEHILDSVIVVTDRKVLDRQLQDTIYQFEHKSGVVQKIEKDSAQLAKALESGTPIIITTLQKFPFVLEKVRNLPNRKYGVIIDEAHSSQGGESARKMKEVLAVKTLEEAQATDTTSDDDEMDTIQKMMASRGKQSNISFFAFTATPKAKTLEVFGMLGVDSKPIAFHLYSMRQAIEEGFILDVLQHYVTYDLYFRLSKEIEEDPHLNKKKASKAIARFVSLHPHNLAQKTEVMVEFFRQITQKKIGGKAKAMVVTSSRLHAKRYYFEFKKYLAEKKYDDILILVAFSGRVVDDDFPEGVSEPELNKIGEKQLPEYFNKDEYRLLLVAEKYQTGYDQPLLHTMFVDKPLSGVKAVQTLSRLNRICPGKEDTFILDFVNDVETIQASFQPYYETLTLTEIADPNHLYDIKSKLDAYQVYWVSEIDQVAKIFFHSLNKLNMGDHQKLNAIIDMGIDRFQDLVTEKQDEFKKSLRTWINLYSFLSQIMPFQDPELEKFYAYARLLFAKLPRGSVEGILNLNDEVGLEYYRLQKINEGAIELEKGVGGEILPVKDAGIKKEKDEKVPLSEILEIVNERFGTDFTDADRFFFEQIEEILLQDPTLQAQARNNSIENFKFGFQEEFINKIIERMDQNKEIFHKILADKDFGEFIRDVLMQRVYKKLKG